MAHRPDNASYLQYRNDTDKSKKFIIKALLLNNRLKKYQDYINYARDHGYRVISLEDFYSLNDRRAEKHFILRHDVDHNGIATKKMYEAEKQVGVTSTYYFRFSTIDNKLIKDMIMDHFNVGLHFETIADYIAESGCNNKYDINMDEMRMRFKKDIERFEKETGVKVRSVCSHGHELNQKLGISNNAITEDQDLSEYGIIFEAYEREMYENDVDCHIMDAGLHRNFGFWYKDNPYDAIDSDYQNIVFLSHPHNWYMHLKARVSLLKAIIVGKASYSSEKTFNRIAK